jgi:hypothetical protein
VEEGNDKARVEHEFLHLYHANPEQDGSENAKRERHHHCLQVRREMHHQHHHSGYLVVCAFTMGVVDVTISGRAPWLPLC